MFNEENLEVKKAELINSLNDKSNYLVYFSAYTDDEYYEKNKKDYLRQINDKKFIDGVLDLLKTRKNNLDGAEDEEYSSNNLDRLINLVFNNIFC